MAGKHGIGRSNMVEDRILGLKAREIYEHPAATVILAAHADLEQLTLTRQELAFKKTVDEKWSELAYMGLVHEPLFHDLSAFVETSQEKVTGKVDLSLYKGCCRVLGRSSPEAVYSEELVSFDSAVLSQTHATGVSAYYGIQARMIQGKKKR
jgi:argininosuccinate synthase